jgi:hypothetical protein
VAVARADPWMGNSTEACDVPVGNIDEERHPVVVAIGSRFK